MTNKFQYYFTWLIRLSIKLLLLAYLSIKLKHCCFLLHMQITWSYYLEEENNATISTLLFYTVCVYILPYNYVHTYVQWFLFYNIDKRIGDLSACIQPPWIIAFRTRNFTMLQDRSESGVITRTLHNQRMQR